MTDFGTRCKGCGMVKHRCVCNRPTTPPDTENFRTCEELDAAGIKYESCTRSACDYARQCQRRQDPLDPFNIAAEVEKPVQTAAYDDHPSWCRCQRVCGGDQ